jgi:hypothetical protein
MDIYERQQNIMNVYRQKNIQSATMTIDDPAFKFEL